MKKILKLGLFGINIHRATKWEGKKSTQIDKWSAGCQVIAANDDFKLFMEICILLKTPGVIHLLTHLLSLKI